MIKTVIFDNDDLLVDSHPLVAQTLNELLKKYGHSFDELPQEVKSSFIGKKIVEVVKFLIEYLHIDVEFEKLNNERAEIFFKLVEEKLEVMPGTMELIQLLKKNNYRIALASSGTKRYINMVLAKFNLQNTFEVVVTGDDVTLGKPNPQIFLIATQRLKEKPEDCLVLEDAENGVEAALAAGCKCIAVRNAHTPPQELSKADLVVNSLSEITLEAIQCM